MPTRPSAPSCSAWASRSSASTRASSTRTRCGSCRSARSARSSPTGRWCSRATGATPRRRAPPSSSIDGKPFFRTGDLGRMDEEGYFFITDRLKRMINASGFKVWPAEVEALLYKHPAVQEACIIAARDAYRGETVKAVVVLRAEARGQDGADRTSSTGRASTWRPTRCRSIVRVRRRAAQVGLGQGDVAAAAGAERPSGRQKPEPRLLAGRRALRPSLRGRASRCDAGSGRSVAMMSRWRSAQPSRSRQRRLVAGQRGEERIDSSCGRKVFGMLEGQVDELALHAGQCAVGAARHQRARQRSSARASPAKARARAAQRVARELVEHDDRRHGALWLCRPGVERAAQRRARSGRRTAGGSCCVERVVLAEPLRPRPVACRIIGRAEPERRARRRLRHRAWWWRKVQRASCCQRKLNSSASMSARWALSAAPPWPPSMFS